MQFESLCFLIISSTLFFIYVKFRQCKKLGGKIPEAALKLCKEDNLQKTINYNKEKVCYNIFSEAFDCIKSLLFLFYLDKMHLRFLDTSLGKMNGFFLNHNVFFMLFYFLVTQFSKLPLEAYFDFVIERKYGFNNKTFKLFCTDIVTNFFLTVCIGSMVLSPAFYIIQKFENFELYLGVFMMIFQIFMIWAFPTIIAPLYNKFSPLEDNSLKEKIKSLAKSVNFKLGKIEVIDSEKRSTHSNAYFTGVGRTKKIVFYSTIFKHLKDDEIVAVLAHELGHWNFNHQIRLLLVGWIQLLGYLLLFRTTVDCKDTGNLAVSFIYFSFATIAIDILLTLVINSIIRSFERQADSFAVQTGHGENLMVALTKLHEENMSAPVVDALYSALYNSHPQTLERLENLEIAMKKTE
ncbi:hypothetical protein GINT2_001780 [Glugoides intestinalis]